MERKFITQVALLFLIMTVFGSHVVSYGQIKPRQLTLAEAIEISRTQSPEALNAKQAFSKSYWEFRSFRASYLPALALNSTLPDVNQVISPYLNADGSQTYSNSQKISAWANLALTQKIGITGGTVSVNSYLSGVHNVNSDNLTPYLSYPVSVEFSQPIFTFNPYRWDKKIKPLSYSIAKRKYIEAIEQIAINTTNYFFTLLQAQVDKKIATMNLTNSDALYTIAKNRYLLGKIAENEMLQMELSFLKAQAALENADLNLDNAQFKFKSFLRIKEDVSIVLLPPGNIDFFKIDPTKAVAIANENSSVPLDKKRQLLEAASAVNLAKLEGRFDAEIHALIGLQQTGATLPDAYINPLDQRQVSVKLTIPIVDWGVAHGQIKMAQSQEEIMKNTTEQELIDFQRDVYLKVIEFNMQQNQLAIAAKSDTVARKSYEVIKGRFLIGKMNNTLELNNAQLDRDDSEKNYYGALQTFWRTYFEIRKLTLFDFITNTPLPFDLRDFK
jgi:outer membrane protein TolC